jgi:hypothetical protein
MTDRKQEIAAVVAAAEIDIDRLDVLQAFVTLRDAAADLERIGVVGVTVALHGAVVTILGPEAASKALGTPVRATEVLIAARAVAARLAPGMTELMGKIKDLTETVPED